MQITFPGADGRLVTVTDPRRQPILTKPGKDASIALPEERRPAGFLITAMKV